MKRPKSELEHLVEMNQEKRQNVDPNEMASRLEDQIDQNTWFIWIAWVRKEQRFGLNIQQHLHFSSFLEILDPRKILMEKWKFPDQLDA